MKVKADYHIHSTYSKNKHGKSTIEEIVQKAIEIGLEEIAITDHGPAHYLFGIKKNKIKEAKNQVIEMRKKYPAINILLGVEANILDYSGRTDICAEIIEHCDIILCGFHLGVLYSTAGDFWNFIVKNKYATINNRLYQDMVEKNTEAVVNAMKRYKIDILTHPGDKIPVNIDRVAETAEKTNTILEINDSHGHLNKEEIIRASKYHVKFVINSDSHIKDNIGSCSNGIKAAIEAGIDLKRIINLKGGE
ncbi:MAG: PHP domain-containing protein [Tissierellia bacterium]|nr:PHP domain-containing protein [Tissierellia bacterium]